MNQWLTRPELKASLLFVMLVVTIIFIGWLLQVILIPLLVAIVFYVLTEPLVSNLQRQGWNRSLIIALLLIITAGIFVWIIVVVIPPLADQFELLRARLPQAWERLSELLNDAQVWIQAKFKIEFDQFQLLSQVTKGFRVLSTSSLAIISGWLANLAFWLLLIPAITFFLLRDYRTLRNALIGTLPNNIFERGLTIYHRVTSQLQRYVRGVLLQSLIMSLVTGTGFFLIGIPMAAPLGLAAGALNLIPYLGPFMALVPPVLVALSIGATTDTMILIVLVMIIAQINDNFLVIPTILARAANLHPLVALIGVIVGGNFFGFAGMILALPVLATARIVFSGLLAGCSQKKYNFSSKLTKLIKNSKIN
ncbi:MAG: AI-2E family transporter [Acidiferrobacterales bacterium]